MNRLTIIGNLTGDPEVRTTPAGKQVCNFTVAVNRRTNAQGQPEADFFRVSAWNALAESCGKWLIKGRKVCVVGFVTLATYETQDGRHGANLRVMAQDVEFLSSGVHSEQQEPAPQVDQKSGMEVAQDEELPL